MKRLTIIAAVLAVGATLGTGCAASIPGADSAPGATAQSSVLTTSASDNAALDVLVDQVKDLQDRSAAAWLAHDWSQSALGYTLADKADALTAGVQAATGLTPTQRGALKDLDTAMRTIALAELRTSPSNPGATDAAIRAGLADFDQAYLAWEDN